MADPVPLLNLYLIRANGQEIPFYRCTTAPTLNGMPVWSGDWRNIFKVDDLQTDLSIMYVQPGGGSVQKPHVISPIRGGYRLKENTEFHVNPATDFHTPEHKLVVMASDLEPCASDDIMGADLRQTELQVSFWHFTVQMSDGSTTMVLPAEYVSGDAIAVAPKVGLEDDNAPDLTTPAP